MSSVAPVRMPITTLDDDAWDDLLSFIEERRVIPIVGPELLQVSTDQGPRLLCNGRRDVFSMSTLLTNSLAKQGRCADSAQVIAPVVAYQRALLAPNHGDEWQHVEMADALYAEASCDAPRRSALLQEAAALIDSVPPPMSKLRTFREVRYRVHGAAG
jgi:hypothetical protein